MLFELEMVKLEDSRFHTHTVVDGLETFRPDSNFGLLDTKHHSSGDKRNRFLFKNLLLRDS